MSNEILPTAPAAEKHVVQRLRPNAVGLGGVLFMTIATAAPITAMLGNVPIAVGSGNGQFAPAGLWSPPLSLPCLPSAMRRWPGLLPLPAHFMALFRTALGGSLAWRQE